MRKTLMEISGDALYENARAIRKSIPENIKMMCVVKADAYGHGIVDAAKTMIEAGADAFAVAIVDEADVLRNADVRLPILVLGGGDEISIKDSVRVGASQAVYEKWMLDVMEHEARSYDLEAKAHLKIDSGMSRIGVRGEDELQELLAYWKDRCPHVEMEGIFTHFCVAESDPEFTKHQNENFKRAVEMARKAGFNPIAHAAATSAMLEKEYQYDMVRAGIGLYGTLVPALEGKLQYAQTLSTWPTRVQWIRAGESVGYGRTFTAQRDTRVMTIPIGYGDGYPRILSNKACALVEGKRAPIIGNVCMDMIMLDVTDIPAASSDSEVVLMGAQGSQRITPDELAQLSGTIPYEIMLGFNRRVRHVFEKRTEKS